MYSSAFGIPFLAVHENKFKIGGFFNLSGACSCPDAM